VPHPANSHPGRDIRPFLLAQSPDLRRFAERLRRRECLFSQSRSGLMEP
jgi:hypothetical protein